MNAKQYLTSYGVAWDFVAQMVVLLLMVAARCMVLTKYACSTLRLLFAKGIQNKMFESIK